MLFIIYYFIRWLHCRFSFSPVSQSANHVPESYCNISHTVTLTVQQQSHKMHDGRE